MNLSATDNLPAYSQFAKLTEDDLASDWHEPEKTKKRKASSNPTKEAEKKKKTVTIVLDDEDMAGVNIPTGR